MLKAEENGCPSWVSTWFQPRLPDFLEMRHFNPVLFSRGFSCVWTECQHQWQSLGLPPHPVGAVSVFAASALYRYPDAFDLPHFDQLYEDDPTKERKFIFSYRLIKLQQTSALFLLTASERRWNILKNGKRIMIEDTPIASIVQVRVYVDWDTMKPVKLSGKIRKTHQWFLDNAPGLDPRLQRAFDEGLRMLSEAKMIRSMNLESSSLLNHHSGDGCARMLGVFRYRVRFSNIDEIRHLNQIVYSRILMNALCHLIPEFRQRKLVLSQMTNRWIKEIKFVGYENDDNHHYGCDQISSLNDTLSKVWVLKPEISEKSESKLFIKLLFRLYYHDTLRYESLVWLCRPNIDSSITIPAKL